MPQRQQPKKRRQRRYGLSKQGFATLMTAADAAQRLAFERGKVQSRRFAVEENGVLKRFLIEPQAPKTRGQQGLSAKITEL